MVAKRSAAGDRTQTINQARALILTGPEDLRARFTGHTVAALVAELASLRPRPGSTVGYATRIALRELGRRAEFLDAQLERLDELISPLVAAHAPGLLALCGVGPHTAALLLIAAGDHPERLRSEAAWAHLCGAAPIPASSGKTVRHRLNPGGDRQANHALWRIVFTRLGSDPATRAYAERRTAEGKSKNSQRPLFGRFGCADPRFRSRAAPGRKVNLPAVAWRVAARRAAWVLSLVQAVGWGAGCRRWARAVWRRPAPLVRMAAARARRDPARTTSWRARVMPV
jgi:hypothetical protein